MKEMYLKFDKKMIEIDETQAILTGLKYYNEETVNCDINVMTYYLKDHAIYWNSRPLFTILSFNESYKIVNHDNDMDIFNGIYEVLTKNDLVKGIK